MPALTFSGNQGLDGKSYSLFRAYASTDIDCVNIVYRGAVTGAPAYAPRVTGPLVLPLDDAGVLTAQSGFLPDGANEGGGTLAADGFPVTTSESAGDSTATNSTASAQSKIVQVAKVDLPDIDFPSTRYYWTVVPVRFATLPDKTHKYVDVDVPQDACAAGRVASFGKDSDPVSVSSTTPYISGPRAERSTAQLRRQAARGLLDSADRMGACNGCELLRGSVVTDEVSVAGTGREADVLDLGRPRPDAGNVVLPRPRLQPGADSQAADGVVAAGQAQRREADVQARRRLAQEVIERYRVGAR